ncbi:hypothetical protein MRX96_049622, partial [Rhipicephalus microplus]
MGASKTTLQELLQGRRRCALVTTHQPLRVTAGGQLRQFPSPHAVIVETIMEKLMPRLKSVIREEVLAQMHELFGHMPSTAGAGDT